MDKLNMHTANVADENYKKLAALFPNAVTETITGYEPELDENGEPRIGFDGRQVMKPIVERAIDADVLMQEISAYVVERREERYQFTWPDKKKAMLAANAPIAATLRPVRADSVGRDGTPGGWDSENLYIEGDNLDVLKLLQETYLGKVKMIYIDPPYNTGNDFVYEDDFAEDAESYIGRSGQFDDQGNRLEQNTESNGRFHTDWLNMVFPRLKLARNLLSDDGVLFVSIDNNEFATMKLLCDSVFGEDCFITVLHVQMSTVQGQKVRAAKQGNIVKNGEFILVYAKGTDKAIGIRPMLDPVKYDSHYNKYLEETEKDTYCECDLCERLSKGKNIVQELIALGLISAKAPRLSSTSLQEYYSQSTAAREYIHKHAERIVRVHDSVDVPESIKRQMREGLIYKYSSEARDYLVSKGTDGSIKQRIALSEKLAAADDFYRTYGPTTIRGDWWSGFYLDMGNVSKEGGVAYDNGKKPVRLIRQLIEFCTGSDAIIMDFFAGSSTTAHAVMEANLANQGHRRFIMIQIDSNLDSELKEASTARKHELKQSIQFLDSVQKPHRLVEIGKERIRRAGRKIRDEAGLTAQSLDIGFRVLRLDSSNMQDVYYNPAAMTQDLLSVTTDNIKPDRTPEDLLFQVMLDLGVELSSPITETVIGGKKVFDVADGFLLACFDTGVTTETVTAIAKKQPYYAVFRDSSMADDSTATNFDQIFETYSPSTVRKVL